MKKTMKVLKWAVLNGLMLAALWYGLVENIQGARNVGLAMVWWVAVLSLFTTSSKMRHALAKQPNFPSVPRSIDRTFDIAVAVLLLWHGLIVTGIAYAISSVLHAALYSAVEEIREKANTPKQEIAR